MPKAFSQPTKKGTHAPLLRRFGAVDGDDNCEAYLAMFVKFGIFVPAAGGAWRAK